MKKTKRYRLAKTQKVIDMLNRAVETDAAAIQTLLSSRVPCTKELARDDIPIICTPCPVPGEHFTLSSLGFINGILYELGVPELAMKWEDGVFVGFCPYDPHLKK